MNTIQELPIQNQQDFWSMLYMHLGKSIMEICGRRGEGAIRHGLHKMAEDDGRRFREECIKQGAKTNLRSLYAMGCACSCDPRVRTKTLCDEEQVHLWETYTCPLANLWLDNDQAFLGNLYCEENQHGIMMTYTGGAGQFHTTKKILCHRTNGCRPDNYCRFAAYYRPANVDKEQRTEAFSDGSVNDEALPKPFMSVQEELTAKCIRTVKYLTDAAEEHFGSEGLCAIALGLRALVEPTAAMMRHYADATLSKDIKEFAAQNLPVSLDTAKDDLWTVYGDERSRELFLANFSVRLKRALSLEA